MDWIKTNLRKGNLIDNKTFQSINDFTLIWMVFEGLEAHNIEGPMIDEIDTISVRIYRNFPEDKLNLYFNYFQRRYTVSENMTGYFDGLGIRNSRLREGLSTELRHPTGKLSKYKTVLKIIYILRNNLFHGLKDLESLITQHSNLRMASSFLQKSIQYSNRYVYINNDA